MMPASGGNPPADGDLPAAIGKPATRALLGAGITTLDQVAEHAEGDLLALHGVGPKAVRLLREELARQGRAMR
jgi:predicted flap endonuclease-1-like 5' DNA nuclease